MARSCPLDHVGSKEPHRVYGISAGSRKRVDAGGFGVDDESWLDEFGSHLSPSCCGLHPPTGGPPVEQSLNMVKGEGYRPPRSGNHGRF
jgi:hypothetical protein